MPDHPPLVLRRHKLTHIPELKVDPALFEATFVAGCSMFNCNANCCKHGVMVDPVERDAILAHADVIKKHMEPHQEKDHQKWFDQEEEPDLDYPSGTSFATQTRWYGCVFLDRGGRCVLQQTAVVEGMSMFALKPFFCYAFPVTIEDGLLMLDDPEIANRPECCSMQPGGSMTVLDVCEEEFRFVLGDDGFSELRNLHKSTRE
ncbi:MAG TPA: DUF3109 domain-containing protein [Bacteroidetes bacterium]|nr:DUF3109 domain-containing protein [Bacteroidota bacterium]